MFHQTKHYRNYFANELMKLLDVVAYWRDAQIVGDPFKESELQWLVNVSQGNIHYEAHILPRVHFTFEGEITYRWEFVDYTLHLTIELDTHNGHLIVYDNHVHTNATVFDFSYDLDMSDNWRKILNLVRFYSDEKTND